MTLVSPSPGLRAGCILFSVHSAGSESLKPKSESFALCCACLTLLSILALLCRSTAKSAGLCILRTQAVLGSSYVSHSWRPVHCSVQNLHRKSTCSTPQRSRDSPPSHPAVPFIRTLNILEETPVTKRPSFWYTLNLIVMLNLLPLNYIGKLVTFIDLCMGS